MTDEVVSEDTIETPIEESQEIVEESEESSNEGVELSAEDGEQLQGEIQEAIDNGATEEEVNDMIEEFVLKVNGKEVKKTVDWNDKESIKRELQKAAAFGSTSQENAEIKKLLQDMVGGLKQDPWKIMQELGLDPDELAEMRIQQKIEDMKKSPDQIEKERIQAELEEMRQKTKQYEDRAREQEMAKLQEAALEDLNNEINTALDAHPSLSASEMTIRRIADTMSYAMDNGIEDVKVEDVLPIVEREMKEDIRKFMDSVPVQFLEEYISQNALENYRKSKIKKTVTPPNINDIKKDVSSPAKKEEKKERQYKSLNDFMRSR